MAQATSDRSSQRYIGDTSTNIVHDSLHEDPTPIGCKLRAVLKSGHAVRFEPDRLGQAKSEGFEDCPRCLYRLEARPGRAMNDLTS